MRGYKINYDSGLGMKAFVFPGQGSQFPGMARNLYDTNPAARDLLEKANSVLGFRITDIMFEGSSEDLMRTDVTQPAVFLHSYVAFACSAEGKADMVAGHSLGEFTALAASGVLSFEDALKLVSLRAGAMQRACALCPGTMAAVTNLSADRLEAVCAAIPGVVPANYNNDAQIVISGEAEAVAVACEKLKEAGARRAIVLPVGGAFHSPLMEPAREELAKAIELTTFNTPQCPVYQNVACEAVTDPSIIKSNLLQQLTSPVKWTQSVRAMLADGADEFVEFGPGTVLQGLIRKICSGQDGVVVKGIS